MAEENSVNFKAFLVDAADASHNEVRRFNVDREVSTNLAYLQSKLELVFPRLRRDASTLTWVDADGDVVAVGSDEELVIALTEMKGPLYKVTVTVKGQKEDNKAAKAEEKREEGELHVGVECDGCEKAVRGFRYKCVACPDYDLCGACEAKGLHPGHNMIRIAGPDAAWPTHFFRRINKMHERIHKRAHSEAARAAHQQQQQQQEFYDEAMDPFSNGGAWVHGVPVNPGWINGAPPSPFEGARPCGPRGRFGGRGRGRCAGGRGARMWEDMVKGWMGEEKKQEASGDKAEDKDKPEAAAKAAEAAEARASGASQQAKSPLEEMIHQFASAGGADYLKNVGSMVAAALDPLGVDVQIDIEHAGKTTNVKKAADKAAEKADKAAEKAEKAEEATEEKPKKAGEKEEEDKENTAEPKVEDPVERKTPSPSIEGEWTVVNNDEQPKVVNIPVHVEQKKEEEPKVEQPKGEKSKKEEVVSVPINLIDQPAKVLFGAPDGTLYPELPKQQQESKDNGEKEMEVKKKVEVRGAEAFTPSAPAANVAEHPDPKIKVALQAMMNMGFTNDGNWLTQLLEAKNGDIGKVLDVLQPVRPVRQ